MPTVIKYQGSIEQLRQCLWRYAPPILHFAGDGGVPCDGHQRTIALTDARGGLLRVSPSVIAETLGVHAPSRGGPLTIAFFNACGTLDLARRVHAEGVPFVICWATRVHTDAAMLFAFVFFWALSSRFSISIAYHIAKAVTARHFDLRDPDTPQAPRAAGVPWKLDPLTICS